jgi:hypothetical protein
MRVCKGADSGGRCDGGLVVGAMRTARACLSTTGMNVAVAIAMVLEVVTGVDARPDLAVSVSDAAESELLHSSPGASGPWWPAVLVALIAGACVFSRRADKRGSYRQPVGDDEGDIGIGSDAFVEGGNTSTKPNNDDDDDALLDSVRIGRHFRHDKATDNECVLLIAFPSIVLLASH